MIDISFRPGDTVKVYQKIKEGDKSRTQMFEGIVLAIKGRGINVMFTVRKVVAGIAIERIWPVASPNIEKVVVKEKGKNIHRAKLYHLRKSS